MRQRLLLALVAGFALGSLVFLIRLSQGFDLEAHNRTLENLRQLKQLDGRLNEETLRARVLIDPDSTALLDLLPVVRKAVKSLNQGANAIGGLGDPAVSEAYRKYSAAMEAKLVSAEQFYTDNLTLAESIDTIRRSAATVLATLPPEKYGPIRQQTIQLLKEVLEFGLLPAPDNRKTLEELNFEFSKATALGVPQDLQYDVVQMSSRSNFVLNQRKANDELLASILSAPTWKTLSALESAYDAFHGGRLRNAEFYRRILVVYAVALLVGLVVLGFRLRKSYIDLNRANAELQHTNDHLEEMVDARTSDLKQAYDHLRESQTQLIQSEKMASLGQMLAGVAQEINVPLACARGNTQRARESLTGDPARLLADSDSALAQIAELVSTLTDFSRLDRAGTEHFNVNDAIDASLRICHHQLKDRIEVTRSYGELPFVQCSPSQLNQVFLNLLTNAAQAIGGRGRIEISTTATDSDVAIRIKDSGHGMDEETRRRVFDPFFTTRPEQSTGLGMSIVYRIVKDHGGSIDVASVPDKGTEFVIRLPREDRTGAGRAPRAA